MAIMIFSPVSNLSNHPLYKSDKYLLTPRQENSIYLCAAGKSKYFQKCLAVVLQTLKPPFS